MTLTVASKGSFDTIPTKMSGSLSHQSSDHSATRIELVIECFYGVQRNKNVSK